MIIRIMFEQWKKLIINLQKWLDILELSVKISNKKPMRKSE